MFNRIAATPKSNYLNISYFSQNPKCKDIIKYFVKFAVGTPNLIKSNLFILLIFRNMETSLLNGMTLEEMNKLSLGTMVENLGIRYTEIGRDYLAGTMPVDERTKQPYGLLHGGASVAFAETLGSMASICLINPETHGIVGTEINATHVKKATQGHVTGRATLISRSRKMHVWEIKITNDEGALVCISRLTVMVISRTS